MRVRVRVRVGVRVRVIVRVRVRVLGRTLPLGRPLPDCRRSVSFRVHMLYMLSRSVASSRRHCSTTELL